MLVDVTDGHPPPNFTTTVLHDTPYALSFHGDHVLDAGDVVRWVSSEAGGCAGAAEAEASLYGGALDSGLTTVIRLPARVDNTPSTVYVLCLAEAVNDSGWSTAPVDSDFTLHVHVTRQ